MGRHLRALNARFICWGRSEPQWLKPRSFAIARGTTYVPFPIWPGRGVGEITTRVFSVGSFRYEQILGKRPFTIEPLSFTEKACILGDLERFHLPVFVTALRPDGLAFAE